MKIVLTIIPVFAAVGVLISVLGAVRYTYLDKKKIHARWDEPSYSLNIFATVVFGLFASVFLGLFVAAGLDFVAPKQYVEQETSRTELIQLQSSQGVEGQIGGFLFISGELGQSLYYSYWYRDGAGFRHGQLTDEDDVQVFEDSPQNPSLKLVSGKNSCKGWFLADWALLCGNDLPGTRPRHEFHIPPGSIVRDIKLN